MQTELVIVNKNVVNKNLGAALAVNSAEHSLSEAAEPGVFF